MVKKTKKKYGGKTKKQLRSMDPGMRYQPKGKLENMTTAEIKEYRKKRRNLKKNLNTLKNRIKKESSDTGSNNPAYRRKKNKRSI